MQPDFTLAQLRDIQEPMFAACDRMLAPFGKQLERPTGIGADTIMPFDIRRPAQHKSKAEFDAEYRAVKSSVKDLKRIAATLLGSDTSPQSRVMVGLLEPVLNEKFRSGPRPGNLRDSHNLIRQNVRDVGGYYSSLAVMTDFAAVLEERLRELESFRETYWNKKNRAADYYARAIALRLARLFARETGKLPTTGTTADTGDPSTQYSRALREVFEILGLKTTQRSYATWAVQQITENDLEPHSGIFGGILGPDIVPESDLLTTPSQGTASNETPPKRGVD